MKGIDLVRKDLRAMKPYEEEPASGLNLSANTNLFGPNPALAQALAVVRAERLAEYPSLSSASLRDAAARRLGVAPDTIVTGNGSNELIDEICRTFLEPGERVAFHTPTFGMIPIFAAVNHGALAPVPLVGPEWSLDVEGLVAADAKLTFIVRPNNPTGNAFPRRDIERVIERSRGLVVIDEAYVEFLGGESFVKEVRAGHDRVVVLRTLSKAYGLAGLRIGYAVAASDVAYEIAKTRGPYKLDHFAETAGALALGDERYVAAVADGVRAERPNLQRALEERGFTVFRSDANFVLTKPPVAPAALARALAQAGVFVRELSGEMAPYLRITVGPPTATARLRVALDDALPKLKGTA